MLILLARMPGTNFPYSRDVFRARVLKISDTPWYVPGKYFGNVLSPAGPQICRTYYRKGWILFGQINVDNPLASLRQRTGTPRAPAAAAVSGFGTAIINFPKFA